MQRLLLALGLFLTLSTNLMLAQGDRERSLRFGIHLSPTFARMNTSDKLIEAAGTNLGAKIGVSFDKFFTNNYAFSSGINFSFNQGGTIQNGYDQGVFWPKSDLSAVLYDTVAQNAKLHYRLSYVEIPVALRLIGGSSTDNPLRYYVEPGIAIGFLSKAIGDIKGATNSTTDEDIKADVKKAMLSLAIGAGAEYEIAENLTLFGGLHYQRGVTDITSDNATVKLANGTFKKDNSKATTGVISIKVGVYF
jgi:opacity protein-like surface antigen